MARCYSVTPGKTLFTLSISMTITSDRVATNSHILFTAIKGGCSVEAYLSILLHHLNVGFAPEKTHLLNPTVNLSGVSLSMFRSPQIFFIFIRIMTNFIRLIADIHRRPQVASQVADSTSAINLTKGSGYYRLTLVYPRRQQIKPQ